MSIQEAIRDISNSKNPYVTVSDMTDIFNRTRPNIEHEEIHTIVKDELTYFKEWITTVPREKHYLAHVIMEWVFRWRLPKDDTPKWYLELRDRNSTFSMTNLSVISQLLEML